MHQGVRHASGCRSRAARRRGSGTMTADTGPRACTDAHRLAGLAACSGGSRHIGVNTVQGFWIRSKASQGRTLVTGCLPQCCQRMTASRPANQRHDAGVTTVTIRPFATHRLARYELVTNAAVTQDEATPAAAPSRRPAPPRPALPPATPCPGAAPPASSVIRHGWVVAMSSVTGSDITRYRRHATTACYPEPRAIHHQHHASCTWQRKPAEVPYRSCVWMMPQHLDGALKHINSSGRIAACTACRQG